jgi:translation initiation factor 4E
MDLKLNNSWNIWYHHILNDWTITGYNKIYTINTIKDFWDFYNNINLIEELNNLHLYFMRENVTPIWEDENNNKGGAWSILVNQEHAFELWEKLAVDLVSDKIFDNNINGVSINQKNNIFIIKIWNNDKNKKNNIILPHYLNCYGNIIYKSHKCTY